MSASHHPQHSMSRASAPGAGVRRAVSGGLLALLYLWFTWAQAGEVVSAPAAEPPAPAADVEFDSQLLDSLGVNIDLARFASADFVPLGLYQLDIIINGKDKLSQQVEVRAGPDPKTPLFCFTPGQVTQWGLLVDQLPNQPSVKLQMQSNCIRVESLVPGASFSLDLPSLSGALSLPQAYVGRVRRDYVGPEQWVQGINAAFVGYNANLYYSELSGTDDQFSNSVNLNTGVNLGAWRLRHNGSWQGSDGGSYQSLNSYVQRDVTTQRAQLTLGEYFTPGDSFDSVPFTGVQLASDDAMLPDFERGFAPVVRGVAQSNARVTIRQGSALIYETQVAPGAFAIDDLYATSFAGDLDVTITEADGSERSFTLPFSSVVQMLRDDTSRFSLTLGRYRNEAGPDGPDFLQGIYRRGYSNTLTLYGGTIAAEDYAALLGGAAMGSDYGALALDVTGSWARDLPASSELPPSLSGQSYRLTYSKQMDLTQTYFTLAAYRFSSEGYLDLNDVAAAQSQTLDQLQRERNRFQLNINQPVGEWGDLYFNGISRDYWGAEAESSSFQLGYNRGFDWGNLTLSASHSLDDGVGDQYMLSLSIPIGDRLGAPRLSSTVSYQEGQGYSARLDLNGGSRDGRFYYGLYGSQSQGDGAGYQGYGANAQYQTAATQLGLSTSQGEGYSQYVASAKGTLLVHEEGWVLGQTQGETMALVEAKGAQGARVSHGIGSEVDGDGYAVLAGLNPYRTNIIGLDPSGLPLDVEIDGSAQMVAPRRGAIVKLAYETHVGQPLLLKVQRTDGSVLPFGAEVVDGAGRSVAVVGQGGLIFVRGEQAILYVQWGKEPDQQCRLDYRVPEPDPAVPYQQVAARCLTMEASS
ncbi:fimbrial biogenesis outer membrane usher protein [Aeromonas encheleia]|uniref:fimbria/pilus outer membrane usher protein n=1 Tax=Aeromonas encheleia TaxID=73010 RepID=UPI001F595E3D|nr:fimbria/pilus outer membrane usher protein [Aeromonas encheleia]UNP87680.1 fimbrial biogenesis outer membrane usher protein [Aeromonas encheleia]